MTARPDRRAAVPAGSEVALRRAGEHAAAQGMNEDVLDPLLTDES